MPTILFLCTANRFRSPLAEAFMREKINEKPDSGEWVIESAGTWTKDGMPALSQTLQVAQYFGLDLKDHRSKQVTAELLSRADLVLVMESGHLEALQIEFPDQSTKIHLLSQVVDGNAYGIPDPYAGGGKQEREIAIELHDVIARGANKIIRMAKTNHKNRTKKSTKKSAKRSS